MNLDNNTPLARPLHLITKDYIGALTYKLTHLDIERHFYTLVLIDNARTAITQQELAQLLGVDKVTMSRIIDYLGKKKYILRMPNPTDRRAHQLKLTEKALKFLPEIKRAIFDLNDASLQGISKKEVDCFLRVAERIHLNLIKLPVDTV